MTIKPANALNNDAGSRFSSISCHRLYAGLRQDAIHFPFNNIALTETPQIKKGNKYAIRDHKITVDEQNLFLIPAAQAIAFEEKRRE